MHPARLITPHEVTHPGKVDELAGSMFLDGWQGPDLIGYQWSDHRIQLLSGSHRLEAAKQAGLNRIPVQVYSHEDVLEAWGDDVAWRRLMRGI